MNGQDLLNFLLSVQSAGIDLHNFEILTRSTTYDGLGQGEDLETYPTHVEIDDNYVVLG